MLGNKPEPLAYSNYFRVFSFICISSFAYVGETIFSRIPRKWATVIAGVLLILIGIDQLL